MLLLIIFGLSQRRQFSHCFITLVLLVEIIGLNLLFALNGGASNPFNIILLIPVVLAFMLLPLWFGVAIQLLSIALQGSQLLLVEMTDSMHHGMQTHYYGMVIGFIFTSLMVGVVIRYFRYQVDLRDKQLQALRERQMRDEQLLSIGTAAAQLTHDVATPVQTIHLLLEEAFESPHQPNWLVDLGAQFSRIETQLSNWREVANDIRENRFHDFAIHTLWQELQSLMRVARPETQIRWQEFSPPDTWVRADRTLLPALTSVIINACEASDEGLQSAVEVSAHLTDTDWLITITNPIRHVSQEQIKNLGSKIMPSERGYGVGAVITNATLEKFAGELSWHLDDNSLNTRIRLPIYKP
jgi:two-component system sensor histidine kinase RegB